MADFLSSLGVGNGDLNGPTSTTKAMLINIVCPRRIGHEKTAEPEDLAAVDKPGEVLVIGVDADIANADGASALNIVVKVENDTGGEEKEEESQQGEPELSDSAHESQSKSLASSTKAADGTPKIGNSRKTRVAETETPQTPQQQDDTASSSLHTVGEEEARSEEARSHEHAGESGDTTQSSNAGNEEKIEGEENVDVPETTAVSNTNESEIQDEATTAVEEDTSEQFVTPEEAAAVTPMVRTKEESSNVGEGGDSESDNDDDEKNSVVVAVEINMEELLRITFDTLLKEWHLLNVPMFSYVDSQQRGTLNPNIKDCPDDDEASEHDEEGKSPTDKHDENKKGEAAWIFLQVMARPNSLGIILERLDRIGVGTNCGTVSIFKVELCKTASPYAHMKQQEEEESKRQLEEEEQKQKKQLKEQESQEKVEGKESDSDKANKATAGVEESQPDDSSDKKNPKVAGEADDAKKTEESDGDKKEALDNSKRGMDDSHTGSSSVNSVAAATAAKIKEKEAQQERIAAERRIEAARAEWKNAATRLRIEQVREQIVEQASLSFDFVSLLSIASILAGVGLITDNTVVIVASMLVSPIMGPVLGLTFGSRIRDWPLVWTSLWHETLSLLGCVLIGACIALCSCWFPIAEDTWPTNEMEGRGETTGLLIGIAIAIPSGMGVCLSILGGNTSSLVGVAISASLLPPAVNAGICFVYAIFLHTELVGIPDSGRDAADFAIIGAISFALTALNIACIWLAGIVMFEIKEVAPTEQKSAFWARDLKVARELNRKNSLYKKPPPVNVNMIKDGIRTALGRRNTNDNTENTKIGTVKVLPPVPPKGARQRPLSASPYGLNQPWQVGHTNKARQRRGGPTKKPADTSNEIVSLFEELPFHDAPDHGREDDIQYVGLEDMAALLGFDREDEDDSDEWDSIDHVAIARRLGQGRYI